jgi:hypothetical protein
MASGKKSAPVVLQDLGSGSQSEDFDQSIPVKEIYQSMRKSRARPKIELGGERASQRKAESMRELNAVYSDRILELEGELEGQRDEFRLLEGKYIDQTKNFQVLREGYLLSEAILRQKTQYFEEVISQ